MASLLGLNAPHERCPVCDLKPQHFRMTETPGIVECHRCGFPSLVDPNGEMAVPSARGVWVEIFQRYYRETGRKLATRDTAGQDPEALARCEAFEAWLREHEDLVARANLAVLSPYAGVTGVLVETEPGNPATRQWNLVLPPSGAGRDVGFPIDPRPFDVGTVITILQPLRLEVAPPESPRLVVVPGQEE